MVDVDDSSQLSADSAQVNWLGLRVGGHPVPELVTRPGTIRPAVYVNLLTLLKLPRLFQEKLKTFLISNPM